MLRTAPKVGLMVHLRCLNIILTADGMWNEVGGHIYFCLFFVVSLTTLSVAQAI